MKKAKMISWLAVNVLTVNKFICKKTDIKF